MGNPRPEGEKITKDIGKIFKLQKELNYTAIKISDTLKIHLATASNYNSSLDKDEERVCIQKVITEIMINTEADEVIKELFDSLKNRHPSNLESIKGSEFVFDYVYLLYHKCHKINPNRDGPYIDSPDWRKNKKATTNSINKKDNKCFRYAPTVALNQEEIGKNSERLTRLKPFLNKYK